MIFYIIFICLKVSTFYIFHPFQVCSTNPLTGWNRDGFCRHKEEDGGQHLVCDTMTDSFLDYTKSKNNDLSTPSGDFPGLKAGDNWCICAARYSEAKKDNRAPPVILESTHSYARHWPLVN